MTSPVPGPRTTRRAFLRLAGASVAFAGLANLRALPAQALEPHAAGERFFAADDAERLAAVAERLVATGDPGMPAFRDTRALRTIDALCARLDPALTGPLPLLLRLVEWGPLLFDWRLARFSRLDAAGQDAHLEGWMRSRFHWRRLGFLALRNLALLGYYSQQETWPGIGYRGPLLAGPGRAP